MKNVLVVSKHVLNFLKEGRGEQNRFLNLCIQTFAISSTQFQLEVKKYFLLPSLMIFEEDLGYFQPEKSEDFIAFKSFKAHVEKEKEKIL